MIPEIEQEVKNRGITRLCHFTPSRNLGHILSGKTGILSTKHLKEDERSIFNPTDLQRRDQHEGYICCSIQYPNAWYFDIAKSKEEIFTDWVVLLIDPKHLWQTGTRFCPRNASANGGHSIVEGKDGFLSLFANDVCGAYGKSFSRQPNHLSCCPTDNQAEVLVPDRISLTDILEIAVETEEQAQNELARLEYFMPTAQLSFIIAPQFFDKHSLKTSISTGILPEETVYTKIEA